MCSKEASPRSESVGRVNKRKIYLTHCVMISTIIGYLPTSRKQAILVDYFLNLKNKQVLGLKSEKDMKMDDDDIQGMGMEVLMPGSITTFNVLYVLLAILANHPRVQDRAFEQITSVLGGKTPTIGDKKSLPYIEALVLETFRYSVLGPFLIPHYTKKGGQINGYLIPENTIIFPNIWNLHHDNRYWDDSWEFDPERFIENGAIVPIDHEMKQRVLIFGAGRRQCEGEIFAKNRLFILVTMMLQKYKFLPAEGFPKPRHDPREYESHITLKIKPYRICVEPRRQ